MVRLRLRAAEPADARDGSATVSQPKLSVDASGGAVGIRLGSRGRSRRNLLGLYGPDVRHDERFGLARLHRPSHVSNLSACRLHTSR